jgi:hypothetical protein
MLYCCPVHDSQLVRSGQFWHCDCCALDYRLRGLCDQCGSELEHLQACGAENWFCPQCNCLRSKSSIRTELLPLDHHA